MSLRALVAVLVAAAAMVAALGLLSRAVLDADRAGRRAEAARLALWRLDARAGALVAAESARPPGAWRSFIRGEDAAGRPVLLPSPLLALPTPPVRLHLLAQDGRLSSPQVPEQAQRRLAAGLVDDGALAEAERRFAALRRRLHLADRPTAPAGGERMAVEASAAKAPPAAPAAGVTPAEPAPPAAAGPPSAAAAETTDTAAAAPGLGRGAALSVEDAAQDLPARTEPAAGRSRQAVLADREFAARSANLAELRMQAAQLQQEAPRKEKAADAPAAVPALRTDLRPDLAAPATARWLGDDLLLEQELTLDGRRAIGMAVVDWGAWSQALLGSVADLMPQARLRPALAGDALVLAALPVALDPGPIPAPPLTPALAWTLAAAWSAGLAGLAAALWVAWAAQRLAERRATFVGAVTHELRTPLTALRLHGDLLADPRVGGDAGRRGGAVAAVRAEAQRLAHLIDNVLDYARLERRRPPAPRTCALDELLAPILPRLRERLAAAGMVLEAAAPGALAVRCDPAAVERILVNLADNAAKYAAGSAVALTVVAAGRRVELRLRDHGPGLAPEIRARLFSPFARSAEAAAGNAPGVGLGLALCRRLARAQGGDLRLEAAEGGGLAAILVLAAAGTG